MAWTVEYTKTALKQLKKLDREGARRILDHMTERIAPSDDPRSLGTALKGDLSIYWRYRVGDYRIICDVRDGKLRILVINLGDRKDIYE